MADQPAHGPESGSFDDMKSHVQTWHGFLKFVKWQVILAIILLAVLLIWRTHN